MSLSTLTKDPDAKLDYAIDWADWLDGDTIASAEWTVPAGLTKVTDSLSGAVATVWLSGGTAGNSYTVTCKVTTDAGRIDERSLTINVEDR